MSNFAFTYVFYGWPLPKYITVSVDTSGFRYSREAELLATSNTSEESARGEEK